MTSPVLPKTIYEFAYATGAQVIAPRRHRRHALNLQVLTGPDLTAVMDLAHRYSGHYNVMSWSRERGDNS